MKRSVFVLGFLTFAVAALPGPGGAALQLTNGCDPGAVTEVEIRKQLALAELRALRKEIADDPSLGDVSDPLADLDAAIASFEESLELITGKDPCTISASEIETVLEGIEAEEVGIESVIDFGTEDFGNDQILPKHFAVRAEAALHDTLAGDEAFAFALLSRVAGQLPSGAGSGSVDPAAALAEAQALQDQCALPRTRVTRETDGTCDDVPGAYSDGIVEIISIIELI